MVLCWQLPEQHWLSFPQPAPFATHVHVPALQKPLQHWPLLAHESPPTRQWPPTHTPLLQVPLQQSANDWHPPPPGTQPGPTGPGPGPGGPLGPQAPNRKTESRTKMVNQRIVTVGAQIVRPLD
jgi:hypothetical protein